MARLIVENAAVAGKSLPPPTDVSWGVPAVPPIVWDGYPDPVDADELLGVTAVGFSQTIPYPTNLAIGDLVLVFLHYACTNSGAADLTLPAAITGLGFSKRLSGTAWSAQQEGYRRVDGTEGASFATITTNSTSVIYHVYRVTNAHLTTAPEVVRTAGAGTNPAMAGKNPAGWDVEKTLWLGTLSGQGSVTVTAPPSGAPLNLRQLVNKGNKSQASSYGKFATPASPSGFYTTGTINFIASTVAVRPKA